MTQSISTTARATVQGNLHHQARLFEEVFAQHAIDSHGIALANIHFDPLRPLAHRDIQESIPLVNNIAAEDLYAYEDAGMTSGAYLAAQTLRYLVTGDADARKQADAVFQGIGYIYELGKAHRPGYFPKPYGGRYSEHLSRDQYLFVMNGLAAYEKIASPEKQSLIHDMLHHMAAYWIDIDYTTSYFGLPSASHLDDYMGSLYLGIMGIAKNFNKDPRLAREYNRLFHAFKLGERMSETLMERFRRGKTYDGSTYFRQPENAMMMKAMAIDFLWDQDPGQRDLWRKSLRAYWKDDLLAPLDMETGLNYFIVGYDPKAGQTFLTEPGRIDALDNPLNLAILDWGGRRQHAGSTQVAYAAAIIADRLEMPEASGIVKHILSKLSLDCFRGITVPSEDHIPPGHRFECQLLNSGHLAYWLWTYWLARERDLLG